MIKLLPLESTNQCSITRSKITRHYLPADVTQRNLHGTTCDIFLLKKLKLNLIHENHLNLNQGNTFDAVVHDQQQQKAEYLFSEGVLLS